MQEHKAWFELAEQNLITSTIILEAKEPVIPSALYHTFTCIELSLKGYLLYNYQSFGKSWDLLRSLEVCGSLDREFASLKSAITQVNSYNLSICYPASTVKIPKTNGAKKCIQHAKKVLTFVKKRTKALVDLKGRRITY